MKQARRLADAHRSEGETGQRTAPGWVLRVDYHHCLRARSHLLMASCEARCQRLTSAELAAQETSLAQLKSRWSNIVARSTRLPTTTQHVSSASSSSARPPSSSSSASSGNTSLATLLESPESSTRWTLPSSDDPALRDESASAGGGGEQGVLQSLLSTASAMSVGAEGLINPHTLQEGKRFWGQLVKTVSAAAGGTVPGVTAQGSANAVANLGRSERTPQSPMNQSDRPLAKLDL
jgi:hypothetical protein